MQDFTQSKKMSDAETKWRSYGYSQFGTTLIIEGYLRDIHQVNVIPIEIVKIIFTHCYEKAKLGANKIVKHGVPKRIQKEIKRLKKDQPPGISITIDENNHRHFKYLLLIGLLRKQKD